MAKKWIKGAIKRPGALTAKAEAAGASSPMAFARSHAHAPGLTGEQARAALNMQGEKIPGGGSRAERAKRRYGGKG